jgi:hypothetical protein
MSDERKVVVMDHRVSGAPRYVAPSIMTIGSVHELTQQQDKKLGVSDGYTFMGAAITNAS